MSIYIRRGKTTSTDCNLSEFQNINLQFNADLPTISKISSYNIALGKISLVNLSNTVMGERISEILN